MNSPGIPLRANKSIEAAIKSTDALFILVPSCFHGWYPAFGFCDRLQNQFAFRARANYG